jgi:hypothetical protein
MAAILDQHSLEHRIEAAIAEATGQALRIVSMEQHVTTCSSSYQTERLLLLLADGRTIELFLKDFSASLLDKSNVDQRWRRERFVYQQVLAGAQLGTSDYYGFLADDANSERGTLLLEYVGAARLRDCESQHWPTVAAWLAKLQARFNKHAGRLAAADLLVRHDEQFFRAPIDKAVGKVAACPTSMAADFQQLLKRYDDCVDVMCDQERTLVHGSFRAEDILFDPKSGRVCAVDWERAALGSQFFDLAYLTDAMSDDEQRKMLLTYCDAAAELQIELPPPAERERIFTCFQAYRLITRLRKLPKQSSDTSLAAALLARLAEVMNRV